MTRFSDRHTNYIFCDRRKHLSLTENKRSYRATNGRAKKIAQYQIDSGQVGNERCDFAVYVFDSQNTVRDDDRLILIELKGSNVTKAISQITQALNDYVISQNLKPKQIDARIVVSRSPNPRFYRTDAIRLKNVLKRYGKGSLEIESRVFSENI